MGKKRVINKKKLILLLVIISLIAIIIGIIVVCNKEKKLEEPYRITLDNYGKTSVVETDEYGRIEEPEDPERSGYRFKGWYIGEEKVDFTEPFTKNTTIRAKWERK